MSTWSDSASARARAEAEELLDSISAAENVIVTTIERECDALRSGHLFAARALHLRLCDTAKLYVQAARATRASLRAIEAVLPGSYDFLEDRRAAFSALLKAELAILSTERAAAGEPAPVYFIQSAARRQAFGSAPGPRRPEALPVRVVASRNEAAPRSEPPGPAVRRGAR